MSDSELDEAPTESADAKAQELKERLAQWKRSRLAPGAAAAAAAADDDDPLDDFMSGLEVPKDVQTHITRPGVVTLDDLAAQLDDDRLLQRASELGRVLVSQDKDLLGEGTRRLKQDRPFPGIVYAH